MDFTLCLFLRLSFYLSPSLSFYLSLSLSCVETMIITTTKVEEKNLCFHSIQPLSKWDYPVFLFAFCLCPDLRHCFRLLLKLLLKHLIISIIWVEKENLQIVFSFNLTIIKVGLRVKGKRSSFHQNKTSKVNILNEGPGRNVQTG